MPPTKKKRCCIRYCNNTQEQSNKQILKFGIASEIDPKWLGKPVSGKPNVLYCCEDHFDLPNDTENFIRYKYTAGVKLKLRNNISLQKKLPNNVCRLCLKLIYNGEDIVDITPQNAKVIASTLPEIDLNMTAEPVSCLNCFECLESYYNIKSTIFKTEITVANYMKSMVKKSPTRMLKNYQIDLFEEYIGLKDMQVKGNGATIEQEFSEVQKTDNEGSILINNVSKKNYQSSEDVNCLSENRRLIKQSLIEEENNIDKRDVHYSSVNLADENFVEVEGISSGKIDFHDN